MVFIPATLNNIKISKKVTKGVWRMPWLREAMKDVTSCDKLRLGANNLLVVDFRMGQPSTLKTCYLFIGANPGN